MLVAMFNNEEGVTRWSDIEPLGYSDQTYRRAMKEFVDLGLAEIVKPRQPLYNFYRLSDFGCLVASLVDEKIKDLDFIVSKLSVK